MSIGVNIDGVNREIKRLGIGQGGTSLRIYNTNTLVDNTSRELDAYYRDDRITGIIIQPYYYRISTYSGTTASSETSVSKSQFQYYFSINYSGNSITISQNTYNCKGFIYLSFSYIWDDDVNNVFRANSIIRDLIPDKFKLLCNYYFNSLESGGSGIYGIKFRMSSSGYDTPPEMPSTVSSGTWYNNLTCSPIYPKANYGEGYFGCGGYNGNARRQCTIQFANAYWNGRAIPITVSSEDYSGIV